MGKALTVQEGGDHYKQMKLQPLEYILANGMPFIEGSVVKYVSRWRAKGGIQDLRKARHLLDVLIEHEERQEATPPAVLPAPAPAAPLTLNAYQRAAMATPGAFPADLPEDFAVKTISVPAARTLMNANLWRASPADEGEEILFNYPGLGWLWRPVKNVVRNMTGNHYRVSPQGNAEWLVPFNHVFAIRRANGKIDLGHKLVDPRG